MTRALRFATLLLTLSSTLPVGAAPPPPTTAEEVDALLAVARERLDAEAEDAVLLLDRLREEWTADGRRVTSVHRLLYVRTDYGADHHADLRVPWDSARQRLQVHLLRTFRLSDRRWVESGPTARVETLPFVVADAPDYSERRETMLLHDGVELPCVLETAYAIEDVKPFRPGADGLWTLSRDEPALRSELVLAFSPGLPLRFTAPSEPEKGRDTELGLDTLTFTAGPLPALPRPRTDHTPLRVPRVAWSTWPSWEALGRDLERSFDAGLAVDEALKGAAAEALRAARTPAETVRRVTAFVADGTRAVRDVGRGWWSPRPAARTWATAYGDPLDRTVLAAALLRVAGLEARLAFRSRLPGAVDQGAATTSLLDGPALWVRGEGVEGLLDLGAQHPVVSETAAFGRALWRPGLDPQPLATPVGESRLALRLDLKWDGEKTLWTGTGVLRASGVLCPHERMVGLGDETVEYLRGVVGKVLAGASVTGANLEVLTPEAVTVGFAVELAGGARDPLDRLRLEIGDPPGVGEILDHAEVHLSHAGRTAPVMLQGTVEQRVELHLELGGLEPVRVPEGKELVNPAGQLRVEARRDGDRLEVERVLRLERSVTEAADWPPLRELLLAHGQERGRTVLLR